MKHPTIMVSLIKRKMDRPSNPMKKTTSKFVRNFQATLINQKWTTDVTEFKIPERKVYLSPIMIISYDISIHPNFN